MGLTDIGIKRAKPTEKPYRLFDGGGLYIEVAPAGGKLWRYKYRFNGKEKRLANGIDPSIAKIAAKSAKRGLAGNSFEVVAREWFENWKLDKAEEHIERKLRKLEKDVFP